MTVTCSLFCTANSKLDGEGGDTEAFRYDVDAIDLDYSGKSGDRCKTE